MSVWQIRTVVKRSMECFSSLGAQSITKVCLFISVFGCQSSSRNSWSWLFITTFSWKLLESSCLCQYWIIGLLHFEYRELWPGSQQNNGGFYSVGISTAIPGWNTKTRQIKQNVLLYSITQLHLSHVKHSLWILFSSFFLGSISDTSETDVSSRVRGVQSLCRWQISEYLDICI